MIETREVNYAYRRGEPVLNDINCKIANGEFIALLGHNGSGKTTLSRLFMALVHPRSGAVYVDDENIEKLEPADLADRVGYVFQNPDLQILADTVWEEVAYGPRNKQLAESDLNQQVEEALQAMGLSDFADVYPRTLSFGQKRRLGVAAALALNPRILILDEITNGQDSLEKIQMMNYLRVLNEEKGITIILITHDMNIARLYAKRVLVLHNGNLVFDDRPDTLFDGKRDLNQWGLTQPTMAELGAALGITALTPAEFCQQVVVKGGETK
ncbi:MAG TPA: energy-coupling factor ABC transporter ATP-binding protein [Candidatus Avacidaminococcus intestinavium]|uniref:Energy-coupling factor ABC transporter ATP-binding protein n=1 Tax=Candidatus Avacidaminococcus intestinavium TaxID=2840684 RepID=A0A9D1MQ03_9FIRM|nr:energy-coupling factor ABC transporter ATP-binding protein [Candidatus Avacidaminococcus intestinavium]